MTTTFNGLFPGIAENYGSLYPPERPSNALLLLYVRFRQDKTRLTKQQFLGGNYFSSRKMKKKREI